MIPEEKNEQKDFQAENADQETVTSEGKENTEGTSQGANEVENLKKENEELKDKYLRLYSEFDNFRRRTSKERVELLKTAGEDVLVSLLPILDDFERASVSMEKATEVSAIKEGVSLIHNKIYKTLEQKGLKVMEDQRGKEFNSEIHEAITQIPAPTPDLKGKIVDVVENGYYLNEKVIRFAKVVIGA
ncbi:MAG: nucleotide exchange factor GrpE [Sporocytophaga sp.]|uniref:nucleotide exchange factor GrpE n=1 Tax=Sporocytophaga sp. TaxID=2231183 RepID=UPI001B0B864D|nr:nucleotide exchange factor GrpE [Sporocytophaga sp.]MBO9701660.1 nucleotide exchange factor GrpE [Sporocytophaga sp.]